ncbi:MAG: M3 family metallopeptidase [Gammaproteobacteria bacterium]|jgi:oligopeptidase A|nr:M3 family metallopeptidase [Gammaproteobacteria bacterium]
MSNPLLDSTGLPGFSQIRPAHVEPALDATLAANRAELERILDADAAPDFDTAILPIEAMHERLHRVWSPVSHLQMVANSEALRAAYNACLPKLSRYSTEMGQNERLYQLYKQVAEQLDEHSDPAQRSLVQHALRDFHLAGVDLPREQKTRYMQVMEELSGLQARFEHNVLDSMAAWEHHEVNEHRLSGMPETVIAAARACAEEQNKDGWVLQLDQPTYVAVITHADDERLRRDFYEAWVTRASDQGPVAGQFDNTRVMEDIMALRHEAARLVGFDNFAAYALASRMAASVSEVSDFLQHLAAVSKPAAEQELDELRAWAGRQLHAWDIAYYSEKLRLERFSISDAELRPYFPLPRVMAGLFGVMHKLYGLRAEERRGIDTWQPEVQYYALVDDTGEEVGGFFMDMFARRNKRSGAWMDECVLRSELQGNLQLPVAHLVCNLTKPSDGQPAQLSHDEIVTLFHEFGHTLHHLLTRVGYPSVSGINGVPWDAVELPSQFMENFAWDRDVVRGMSQHVKTGAPLPEDLLAKLESSRSFQAGLQMVRQIEFALFDWRLHAEYDPARGPRVREILREVRERVAVIEAPAFSRIANSFTHVFGGGYAAGYYSYKWAEVLAADAFAAFEEKGLFNRQVADSFREKILEIGGTRDIAEAFREFRGRAPRIEPLLAQAGISTRPPSNA